jgi:hypothetical protein
MMYWPPGHRGDERADRLVHRVEQRDERDETDRAAEAQRSILRKA